MSQTEADLDANLTTFLREGKKDENVVPYPSQLRVAKLLIAGKSVMGVEATSSGKTESWYLALRYIRARDRQAGPAVVFVPTNALLNDQIKRAEEFGFNVAVYGAQGKFPNSQENTVMNLERGNSIDVLFMTVSMMSYTLDHPRSRLNSLTQFRKIIRKKKLKWTHIPLVVIDEIHTITEARGEYMAEWRTIWSTLAEYPWFKDAPKLGSTATLDSTMRKIVGNHLPESKAWELIQGDRYRENLVIRIVPPHSDRSRKEWTMEYCLEHEDDCILVFMNDKRQIGPLVKLLKENEINAAGYDADLGGDERSERENRFLSGDIRVLVATKALGVGFNKRDIRHVIHLFTPGTPTEYYQQIGRAGRDGEEAWVVLLPTSPFSSSSVENAIVMVCNYVKSSEEGPERADLIAAISALSKNDLTDGVIEMAINQAKKEGFLTETNGIINWNRGTEERLSGIITGTEKSAKDVTAMKCFSKMEKNSPCLWKQLLKMLDSERKEKCGKCSVCDPDTDIIVPSATAHYRDIWHFENEELVVHGLHQPGETLCVGEARLTAYATRFMEGFQSIPANWCIVPVPSTRGDVKDQAQNIANHLKLDVIEPFTLDSRQRIIRSMREAKTEKDRKEVTAKYLLDESKIPTQQRVLLYDDVMNTGTTILHLARLLQEKGKNVLGVVQTAYPNQKNILISPDNPWRKIDLADDDEEMSQEDSEE